MRLLFGHRAPGPTGRRDRAASRRSAAPLLAVLALLLSACVGGGDRFAFFGLSYIENPEEITAAADWENAETINLDIRQNQFRPTIIRIFQGEPYILVIENRDLVAHSFTAIEFFKSIAVRKLVVNEETEIILPRLTSIGLESGDIKELHFVPVRDGWYSFEDGRYGLTIGGGFFSGLSRGAIFGTVGSLIVEE